MIIIGIVNNRNSTNRNSKNNNHNDNCSHSKSSRIVIGLGGASDIRQKACLKHGQMAANSATARSLRDAACPFVDRSQEESTEHLNSANTGRPFQQSCKTTAV